MLKRFFSILYGTICIPTGMISGIVAIGLLFIPHKNINNFSELIIFVFSRIVLCELFFAFGISCFLIGLRHLFNRKDWFKAAIEKYWGKAFKIGLAIPMIGMTFAVIAKFMKFF